MRNQVQLITYVDRLSGDFSKLGALLNGSLGGVFGGVHLLPFFHPIDGADAGFDPADHTEVGSRLGDWNNVRALGETHELVADLIVNHISNDSPQFKDFSHRGADSPFAGMFLTYDRIFPAGASEADLLRIYRPCPGLPFTSAVLKSGEKRLLWTTFTPQQFDIDVTHPQGEAYLRAILCRFQAAGVHLIRLDAVGYAIKKAGTSFTCGAAALGPLAVGAISDAFGDAKYGFVLATGLAGLLFVSLLLNWIFNPARELLEKLDRTEYDVISARNLASECNSKPAHHEQQVL